MKKVKVGILGFGNMGQLHFKNCLLMRDVEVAVADTSKLALVKAKRLGIKEVYTDYEKLLQKTDIDAVLITLPTFLHKERACSAAEKGFHIFIEKPLARTAEECQTILHSVKENDVKLMVGFHQRFIDQNQNLKLMMDSGALGDIELIVYEWVYSGPFLHTLSPVPEWWFDAKKVGGGVLLDTGSHMIDLIRWLFNDEASVQQVFLGYKFQLPLEDTAVLFLSFKNRETKAVLISGWFSRKWMQRVDLHGTAGSISLDLAFSTVSMKKVVREISKNVIRKLLGKEIQPYSLSESNSRAYYEELKHFINCIREDREPSVTGKDGLECAKLIDEAYDLWRSKNQNLG